MHARLCVLCSLLAACVSTPPPASGDGGPGDGSPGTSFCGSPSQYEGESFPPGGVAVEIREVVAADVNNDGDVDLLLSSAITGSPLSDDNGFYVLLGPQDDDDSLLFHAFVPTNVVPHAIAVRDVLGGEGGCLDVAVFGRDKPGNTGFLEVYELTGPPAMFDRIPVAKDAGFMPNDDGSPVMVTFGDFEGGDHGIDVAVADLNRLRLLFTGGDLGANLPTSVPRALGPMGGTADWGSINAVYPYPSSPGGVDDLVIVELDQLSWLHNDGSGGFIQGPVESSGGVFSSKAPRQADVDHAPELDIVGAAGVSLGAYLIDGTGPEATISVRPWNHSLSVYNELNDVVVADLDGTGQPEVVVVEYDEAGVEASLALLVDGLFDAGSELEPTTVSTLTFSSTPVSRGTAADFDGDGRLEVWLFAEDGYAECIQRSEAVAGLEDCAN